MKGEKAEQWVHLCELAATEQDSEKLMELAAEIDRLLEEKRKRLAEPQQQAQTNEHSSA